MRIPHEWETTLEGRGVRKSELALARTRKLYEHKGYQRDWVEKRLRGIGARHELTGQWYRRGLRASQEFRALSNVLSQGVFGMDVAAYRRYKGLRSESLRDHMSELELALLVLGETTASLLHKERNSQGFEALNEDVKAAGAIAGQTRQQIEEHLGRSIMSPRSDPRPMVG